MRKLWQGIAVGVLGVAACQWLSVGGQIVHGAVLTLKTGWSTPVPPAGTGMLKVFLAVRRVRLVVAPCRPGASTPNRACYF